MGYKAEYETLSNAFLNGWNVAGERAPIAWGNLLFSPPDPPSPWVRFTVVNGSSEWRSCGAPGRNVARYAGVVMVQVFVPFHSGEIELLRLVDVVLGIFRGRRIENMRFSTAYAVRSDASNDKGWLQMTVSAPFVRDELE